MPAQELVFAIRVGDPTAASRFVAALREHASHIAAGMGVELVGDDVVDVWEPGASPPAKSLVFGNNRVLDGQVPPNTEDEF